ncbi:MAG: hypothetical protein LUJ25_06195 [Firmicutes bacterium]|nr:hypothetical protein [Bacillota bacterium]
MINGNKHFGLAAANRISSADKRLAFSALNIEFNEIDALIFNSTIDRSGGNSDFFRTPVIFSAER